MCNKQKKYFVSVTVIDFSCLFLSLKQHKLKSEAKYKIEALPQNKNHDNNPLQT